MGKIIVWTGITVLFFALIESVILSNIVFLPVTPDLVLLIVVYVSFMNSPVTGITSGFISGLVLDFLSASPIGLNAFVKTITCFVVGKFSGSFNPNRFLIPALMGFCSTIFKAFMTWVLSFFFGSNILIYKLSDNVFWFEILANTICAPLVFSLLGFFTALFIENKRLHE